MKIGVFWGVCIVTRRNVLVHSTLKKEEARSPETFVAAYHVAWPRIPEYRNLHCHCRDNRCRLRPSENVCTAQAEGMLRAVWLTHCFSSYLFIDHTEETESPFIVYYGRSRVSFPIRSLDFFQFN